MTRLLPFGLLLLLGGGQARAQPAPPARPGPADVPALEVTSDSRAYCRTLSRQIETHRELSRAVRELEREGGALCDEGQVRGGISRLRRALMAIRSERDVAPP